MAYKFVWNQKRGHFNKRGPDCFANKCTMLSKRKGRGFSQSVFAWLKCAILLSPATDLVNIKMQLSLWWWAWKHLIHLPMQWENLKAVFQAAEVSVSNLPPDQGLCDHAASQTRCFLYAGLLRLCVAERVRATIPLSATQVLQTNIDTQPWLIEVLFQSTK